MEYIKVGKIVNTHGIKGEIRILSDFKYKTNVFTLGFHIYIGKEKKEEIISSYRRHKIFDMITLNGINNINDVLPYKGKEIYIKKADLKIDGYLNEDLIGLKVIYQSKQIGIITSIMKNHDNGILVIRNKYKKYLVPNREEFIEKIDLKENHIVIKYMEGLIDEDWYSNIIS